MIGVEQLVCYQLAYLANSFYEKETYIFSSVTNVKLVSAYWSLFYDSADSEILPPFTERVEITPFILQNNLIIIAILFIFSLVLLILNIYQNFSDKNVLKK